MKLRILGCSGGIGSVSDTTSMLLDTDISIDAGTGVGNLTLEELLQIDHIFITHAYLGHIVFIPFLVDTAGCMRQRPITHYRILKPHWIACEISCLTGISGPISQKYPTQEIHICAMKSSRKEWLKI